MMDDSALVGHCPTGAFDQYPDTCCGNANLPLRSSSPSTDTQAAKQAQLQKALSAAYLNHQISELESKVRGISLPQAGAAAPQSQSSPQRRGPGGKGNRGKQQQAAIATGEYKDKEQDGNFRSQHRGDMGRRVNGDNDRPGNGYANGNQEEKDHHESNAELGLSRKLSRDQFDDIGRIDDVVDGAVDKSDWRVAVVDVSALMWASKRVRALVGYGWEVIVPLEGEWTRLNTLEGGETSLSPSTPYPRPAQERLVPFGHRSAGGHSIHRTRLTAAQAHLCRPVHCSSTRYRLQARHGSASSAQWRGSQPGGVVNPAFDAWGKWPA